MYDIKCSGWATHTSVHTHTEKSKPRSTLAVRVQHTVCNSMPVAAVARSVAAYAMTSTEPFVTALMLMLYPRDALRTPPSAFARAVTSGCADGVRSRRTVALGYFKGSAGIIANQAAVVPALMPTCQQNSNRPTGQKKIQLAAPMQRNVWSCVWHDMQSQQWGFLHSDGYTASHCRANHAHHNRKLQ